jgi:hypothetical protein
MIFPGLLGGWIPPGERWRSIHLACFASSHSQGLTSFLFRTRGLKAGHGVQIHRALTPQNPASIFLPWQKRRSRED